MVKNCDGMMLQADGTPFDWFESGQKYSLHGFIDDATGKITGLYMCKNECLLGYERMGIFIMVKSTFWIGLYYLLFYNGWKSNRK